MKNVQQWEEAARLYARVAPRLDARLAARHGIALSELFALRSLAGDPKGHKRIQALADEAGLSPSATSRLVGRLETAGLLSRFVCETDKRGMFAALTDAGRAELEAAEITYAEAVREILADDVETPTDEAR